MALKIDQLSQNLSIIIYQWVNVANKTMGNLTGRFYKFIVLDIGCYLSCRMRTEETYKHKMMKGNDLFREKKIDGISS